MQAGVVERELAAISGNIDAKCEIPELRHIQIDGITYDVGAGRNRDTRLSIKCKSSIRSRNDR